MLLAQYWKEDSPGKGASRLPYGENLGINSHSWQIFIFLYFFYFDYVFIIIMLFGNYVYKYDRLLDDVIFGLNVINFHEKHRFVLEARNWTIIYT